MKIKNKLIISKIDEWLTFLSGFLFLGLAIYLTISSWNQLNLLRSFVIIAIFMTVFILFNSSRIERIYQEILKIKK